MKFKTTVDNTLALMLASAAILVFAPFITGHRMFFLVDVLHEQYAWQAIVSRVLAEAPRSLPTWNPYSFCGSPLLADPEMQVYYPPSILYRFFSFPCASGCWIALHLALGLAGTYSFLRSRDLGRGASVLGGISFALGGHPFALLVNAQATAALCWLPLVAVFADRLALQSSGINIIGLGIVFTWLALAGHPQYVLYGFTLAVLIAAFSRRNRLKTLAGSGTALLLASTIAAAAVIPEFSYILSTGRGEPLSPGMARVDDLVPGDLMSYIVPLARLAGGGLYAGRSNWAALHFTGILPITLAIMAIFIFWRQKHIILTPVVMVITGIVLGLGHGMPFVGGLLTSAPPFSHIRHAALWMFLTDFGIAWLAAIGTDRLFRRINSKILNRTALGWLVAGSIAGAAYIAVKTAGYRLYGLKGLSVYEIRRICLALYHPAVILTLGAVILWCVRKRISGAKAGISILTAVTFAELLAVGFTIQPSVRAAWIMKPTEEERFLVARKTANDGWLRVIRWPTSSVPGVRDTAYVTGRDLEDALHNVRATLQPNLPAISGIRTADGDNPLLPRRIDVILRTLRKFRTPWEKQAAGILENLSVGYIITGKEWRAEGVKPDFSSYSSIFKTSRCLPPVRVEPAGHGSTKTIRVTPGYWELQTTMNHRANLVIAENFQRGWRVVEPSSGKLTAVHGGIIGIGLPSGKHIVKLRYDPPEVKIGLYASLTALLVILTVGILGMVIPSSRSKSGSFPLGSDRHKWSLFFPGPGRSCHRWSRDPGLVETTALFSYRDTGRSRVDRTGASLRRHLRDGTQRGL